MAAGDNTAERAANAATTPGDQNVTGADQQNDTTAAAADQNAANSSDVAAAGNDQNGAAAQGSLPQTASPLPLLGLLGFGSTAVGAFLRRRK